MNEYKAKIILHYLPPSELVFPSPAFSILKGFLESEGFNVEVIYWNLLLKDLIYPYFSDYFNYKDDFGEHDRMYLVPFLSLISERYQDARSKARIIAYLERIFPRYLVEPGKYSDILAECQNGFFNVVDSVLKNRTMDDVILFGFSSKFYQWLPGMFLAEKLKERFPRVKTVVGGFGSKEAALAALEICQGYDFAVWGEGEYPLLELSTLLVQGNSDYKKVPRLVFRQGEVLQITDRQSKYLDFQAGILPDYRDYFNVIKENNQSVEIYALPVEFRRGCHWNKCKFCFLNAGYEYRSRSPENIVKEIETLYKTYGITRYQFVCNDIVGPNIHSFEKLLDLLIELADTHQVSFNFHAEAVHRGFNSQIIKKMALAGFSELQIGYEAITDQLLKKMDKKTDAADTLLFLKFAQKYGIEIPASNIMRGIVGETEDDVLQSIKNLPFLRFFLAGKNPKISHRIRQLRLQANTRFFKLLDKAEREKWNFNAVTYLLPGSFIEEEQRFNLFDWCKPLDYQVAWDLFAEVNRFYEQTEYTYRIIARGEIYYYYEYMGDVKSAHRVFDQPEYWQVLKTANHEVVSFERIWENVSDAHPGVSRERLLDIIEDAKSSYLLYVNDDLSRIISIIDTDLVD